MKDTRKEVLVKKLSYCLVFVVARGLFSPANGPARGRRSCKHGRRRTGVDGKVCHSQGDEHMKVFALDDAFATSVSCSI